MPRGDGTGPVGQGLRDGSGRTNGGRGQRSTRKGTGRKTGGGRGTCK